MSFNSLIFILYFLPLSLLIYYLCKEKYRNTILLLASIIFFMWGSSKTFTIILFSILVNYLLGYLINKVKYNKKLILTLGLIFNILLLVYFKYTNFFINTFNKTFGEALGVNLTILKLIIPLGISYITFQQISYIVDIYKGKVSYDSNFINYSLYILFFPKIIAGPITQYHNINKNIASRTYSNESFNKGIYRFSIGLGKKVIISSVLEMVANNIFSLSPDNLSFNIAWLGMITYTLQIYFDFSGYTDMAIGIAELFSISLPENFNKPYKARGFQDFWRRWHISLSSFLRDYIYIPLGGSRVSKNRMLINTLIVFFISGFWHGANFTFIVWGLYHGFWVIAEKLGLSKLYKAIPSILGQLITFLLVGIGWIFFRSETLAYSISYISKMFKASNIVPLANSSIGIDSKFIFIFVLALLLVFIPKIDINKNYVMLFCARIFSLLILIYSIAIITTGSFMPFIYFNF